MATIVTTRTCVCCKGEGSYIEHVWPAHLARSQVKSLCPSVPSAIGEQREVGRCAQVRCPHCDGFGIFVSRSETGILMPAITGTTNPLRA